MGVVHLARRPGGERVALKVLRPHIVGDDEARRRLAREVSSLSRVRSRRVAEILDADPWGDVAFIATRYVPGLSLHDHIHDEGVVEGAELVWFAGCLAEALSAVHGAGVLHRDIKPSNILMEGRTPILIDFGLARVADDPKLTHTGWLLGTPGYLAPEILFGEDATTASDVHSWGATVAFAGTGRGPFGRGPSMAIMDRVRRGEHDLSGLDPTIRRAVEDTLDPQPRNRPTLDELRQWLATQGPDQRPPDLAESGPPPRVDPFTLPLAVAAQAAAAAPTALEGPLLGPESRRDSGPSAPLRWTERASPPYPRNDPHGDPQGDPQGDPPPTHPPTHPPTRPRATRVLPDGRTERLDTEPASAWTSASAVAGGPVGGVEKLRRGVLVLAGISVVGAGVALAPYVALALLSVMAWILRSASLAGSSAGRRRQTRGAKWYDGVLVLLAAPWHAVASIPGVLLLVMWSIGLALAAALLCFAVSVSMLTSLGTIGVVFGAGMWWGPGSRRVRGPVQRLSHPVSARPLVWFFAAVATLALATGLAATAASQGPVWSPAGDRPFADYRLPAYLQP